MSANVTPLSRHDNLPFYQERADLACAFRWTARDRKSVV
jgi:hypothetical protein